MADFLKVKLTFKNITPIFSSGESIDLRQERVAIDKKYIPLRTTSDGRVQIPLKGRLRVATEKLLQSRGEPVCDLDKDVRGCGNCKACDIYGSSIKRGRWLIGDLFSKDKADSITRVFTHMKLKRKNWVIDPKRIYNTQEVLPESVFESEIIILEPKDDDLDILLASARLLRVLGVGGFTSRGYGRIELENYTVSEHYFKEFLNDIQAQGSN